MLQPTELQPHGESPDSIAAVDRLAGGPCVFCHDTGFTHAWFLADGGWGDQVVPCSCLDRDELLERPRVAA